MSVLREIVVGIIGLTRERRHRSETPATTLRAKNKALGRKEKEMTELKEVLEKHRKWLTDEEGGECADLSGANLSCANLSGAIYNEHTAFFALCCPEEGSFVGYKKAGGKIVKLQIPKTAKRSSATSRKCRCSKAKVISITNTDGSESGLEKVDSDRDASFVYEVGKTVSVDNFDENRWNECSTGIHFFITRDEAVRYN